jgi:hypothetical protein
VGAPSTVPGPTGPSGATGAAGPQGATGAAGLSGVAVATVADFQGTSSESYTDLFTFGPSVAITVPASGQVLVTLTAQIDDGQSDQGLALMSFTSAGGSGNVSASDSRALKVGGGGLIQGSATYHVAGLSPGGHTFTAKYRAGVGTLTAFRHRSIIVIPLP